MAGMNALITVAAALGGVIIGAVLKHFFDVRAGRQAKLLDEKLKHAVAFLSAADWTGRSYEAHADALRDLERAIADDDARALGEAERDRDRSLKEVEASLKDAHTAACALRLLMPELGNTPGDYIQVSLDRSDGGHSRRDGARAAIEARLVQAFQT